MEEIRRSDRVIVFVSHSLPAVESLCDRALWLDHGVIRVLDNTKKVITAYINETNRRQLEQSTFSDNRSERKGSGEVRISSVRITGANGMERDSFSPGRTSSFACVFQRRKGFWSYLWNLGMERRGTEGMHDHHKS